MRSLPAILLFLLTFVAHAAEPLTDKPTVFVLVGAAGEEEFGRQFADAAAKWERVATQAQAKLVAIGWKSAETNDLARFKAALEAEPKEGAGELWLVLLGHGTFDGKEGKFNLRGPDFTASELADWLKPFKRPVAVVNCSSASGPFLAKLSAPGRVQVRLRAADGVGEVATEAREIHLLPAARRRDHDTARCGKLREKRRARR